jgi:hypothetical protein
MESARKIRNPRITDELLDKVAEAYTNAPPGEKSAAVQAVVGCKTAHTATYYVHRARLADKLPPAEHSTKKIDGSLSAAGDALKKMIGVGPEPVPVEAKMKTYEDIVAFGKVMADNVCITSADLQYYYEKPYKWSPEYSRWVAEGRPEVFDADDAISQEAERAEAAYG